MYLNRLNEEQKDLFIDLCIHAALANDKFVDEEKELINVYCDEMNITSVRYEANRSLDEVVEKLIGISTKEELRIIILEITALMISDKVYDEAERKFMKDLSAKADLSEDKQNEMLENLHKLTDIYKAIDDIVYDR